MVNTPDASTHTNWANYLTNEPWQSIKPCALPLPASLVRKLYTRANMKAQTNP